MPNFTDYDSDDVTCIHCRHRFNYLDNFLDECPSCLKPYNKTDSQIVQEKSETELNNQQRQKEYAHVISVLNTLAQLIRDHTIKKDYVKAHHLNYAYENLKSQYFFHL